MVEICVVFQAFKLLLLVLPHFLLLIVCCPDSGWWWMALTLRVDEAIVRPSPLPWKQQAMPMVFSPMAIATSKTQGASFEWPTEYIWIQPTVALIKQAPGASRAMPSHAHQLFGMWLQGYRPSSFNHAPPWKSKTSFQHSWKRFKFL